MIENGIKLFDALSDKTRVEIVELLREKPLCAQEILEKINLSQPALSHHLKILYDARVLIVRKDGNKKYYAINKNQITLVIGCLSSFLKECY